jgi:NADPH:quinone reductase-like Zn-dependent oxidoreductase
MCCGWRRWRGRCPGPGQVLVEVRAAGIQPGEVMIREGARHDRWPATFPSGQGSDLAGVVVEVGSQARGVAVGDEVLGFTHHRAGRPSGDGMSHRGRRQLIPARRCFTAPIHCRRSAGLPVGVGQRAGPARVGVGVLEQDAP